MDYCRSNFSISLSSVGQIDSAFVLRGFGRDWSSLSSILLLWSEVNADRSVSSQIVMISIGSPLATHVSQEGKQSAAGEWWGHVITCTFTRTQIGSHIFGLVWLGYVGQFQFSATISCSVDRITSCMVFTMIWSIGCSYLNFYLLFDQQWMPNGRSLDLAILAQDLFPECEKLPSHPPWFFRGGSIDPVFSCAFCSRRFSQ